MFILISFNMIKTSTACRASALLSVQFFAVFRQGGYSDEEFFYSVIYFSFQGTSRYLFGKRNRGDKKMQILSQKNKSISLQMSLLQEY